MLAHDLGLSEVAIQNYESGRRKPAYDSLIALADQCEIDEPFSHAISFYGLWTNLIIFFDDFRLTVFSVISEPFFYLIVFRVTRNLIVIY